MKILKRILALVLLCAAVPTLAQEARGVDKYSYEANPGCQIKISVQAGATKYTINYSVSFNGAPTSVQGTVDPNGLGDVLLPASRQWYNLSVDRAEADKDLYAVKVGCDTAGGTSGVLAPTPILTLDQWNSAQQLLTTFVQQRQGSTTASGQVTVTQPTTSTGVCAISTAGTIRMRDGHSTTAAIVGNLPRNVQFTVLDRFAEVVGRRTRTWYRIDKAQAAPASDAAEIWVGGTVKTSGCGTSTAGSAPVTASGAAVANAVIPQAGTWTLTYGFTVNVSCNGMSADFTTNSGQTSVSAQIANAGSGFTFEGFGYNQDTNGTWHSSFASAQATGEALIRVDTSTRILGDLLITSSTMPNCTFKIPFWAAPR